MIGNSAAALHGAPVTTLDIDFMFRKTPLNLKKLKSTANSLQAVILKPYYPASDMFRVVNDEGIQLDFMSRLHCVRSFEGLKSRATSVDFGSHSLSVASLADIIRVSELPGVRRIKPFSISLKEHSVKKKTNKKPRITKAEAEDALARESERALVDQIRRLLALSMNKRTHFLRVRHPNGGSHL